MLILFVTLPLFILYSKETVKEVFYKKLDVTPELIKEWKVKSQIDESYDFVRYKIKNETLFSQIAEISNKVFSKESKRYGPKSIPKMEVIEIKGIIYIMLYYNPFQYFEQPCYSMSQPAGFVTYKGRNYELTFWSSDTVLFSPTKRIKRVLYKKNKRDLYVHFESPEVYIQIKGNEVKEISGDTIIR